jgi:hypothetical protein
MRWCRRGNELRGRGQPYTGFQFVLLSPRLWRGDQQPEQEPYRPVCSHLSMARRETRRPLPLIEKDRPAAQKRLRQPAAPLRIMTHENADQISQNLGCYDDHGESPSPKGFGPMTISSWAQLVSNRLCLRVRGLSELRYGSSGALRGMVEAWRKRCGTFYEMPLTSKTSRLGAWVPKSPRCSRALGSTRRFPNCVGTRLSLRPLIDDCSRYQRALGAHASISGQAGS